MKATFDPMELTDSGQALMADYLSRLTAPLDGMWETAFIAAASHFAIRVDDRLAGLMCVDGEENVLLFHLKSAFVHHAQEAFVMALKKKCFRKASVGTNDPLFLSLALEHQQKLRINTYLFENNKDLPIDEDRFPGCRFRPVTAEEIDAIVAFVVETIAAEEDWVYHYFEGLIDLGQLYVFKKGNQILGTGELRVSASQPPYADLGMIAAKDHRGKGIGSEILNRLKHFCQEKSLTPICSTTSQNQPALRAIHKAGFVSRHRIFDVSFS